MVPAESDKITRVSPYSGYFEEFTIFRLQDYHLLRCRFPTTSTILWFCNSLTQSPTTPVLRLVWALSFSLATTKEIDCFLSFPPVTKMFQFTGLHLHSYVFTMQYLRITVGRFPHSEISGSKLTYSSPKHIVVRHVLHQLLVPRHPPCALTNLTTICLIFYILIWWDQIIIHLINIITF